MAGIGGQGPINVAGLDIFHLLQSNTSEGTALRNSLGNFLKFGEEGSSSSKVQEDQLNAVISNYRKTSKSEARPHDLCAGSHVYVIRHRK